MLALSDDPEIVSAFSPGPADFDPITIAAYFSFHLGGWAHATRGLWALSRRGPAALPTLKRFSGENAPMVDRAFVAAGRWLVCNRSPSPEDSMMDGAFLARARKVVSASRSTLSDSDVRSLFASSGQSGYADTRQPDLETTTELALPWIRAASGLELFPPRALASEVPPPSLATAVRFLAPYAQTADLRGRPVRRAEPKIGRNEACPCGSGLKAKRCRHASAA
jgi:hypothetical protein